MELQTYINNHENYISDFKKLGFKVNHTKTYGSHIHMIRNPNIIHRMICINYTS